MFFFHVSSSYFSPLLFSSFQSFLPGFHSEIKATKKGLVQCLIQLKSEKLKQRE